MTDPTVVPAGSELVRACADGIERYVLYGLPSDTPARLRALADVLEEGPSDAEFVRSFARANDRAIRRRR